MANTFLAANEPSLGFVCFFGVAIVFAGLAILIGLVYLMNYLCDRFVKEIAPKKQMTVPTPVQTTEIPNREEIVAAVIAAIAEEENTDISAIRVLSFKKV
ncbi:MAG: OadG family protein [Clostridia bacterium]|nr:OadG family protein [Clostridia bacterium]